jgi:hypothetical protein
MTIVRLRDTICTFPRELSSPAGAPIVLEQLSGVREQPMIISMPTTARPQHRCDHRLRHFVQRTGDGTVATDVGVARLTARGRLGQAPKVVVSLDKADLRASALQQEVLQTESNSPAHVSLRNL